MEPALGSLGPFGVLLKPILVCFWPVCVIILVVWSGIPALPASVFGRKAPMKKLVISWVGSWGEGVVAFFFCFLVMDTALARAVSFSTLSLSGLPERPHQRGNS